MEEILILRHGDAQDLTECNSSNDFDRALTDEGKKKIIKVSKLLKAIGQEIDIVLSSPFIRAKQTAEIITENISTKNGLKIVDFLGCGSSVKEIAKGLTDYTTSHSVMLIGHIPDLELFLGKLICAERIKLKKAAIGKVKLENSIELSGELEWLITPKILKKIKLKKETSNNSRLPVID